MGFAYSINSNGYVSFRAVDDSSEIVSGEAYFATTPTTAELQSAFAGYTAAVTAQTAQTAAAALLAGGLIITSTSTPALNGTYGTRPQDQINVTGLQTAIAASAFPGFYFDNGGAKHTMTAAAFTALATAILDFIVAVDAALETALAGGAWVAPSASVTIA